MSFTGIWFGLLATVYVFNSVLNTLLKIYVIFDSDEHKDIPENIKKSMYS